MKVFNRQKTRHAQGLSGNRRDGTRNVLKVLFPLLRCDDDLVELRISTVLTGGKNKTGTDKGKSPELHSNCFHDPLHASPNTKTSFC